MPLLIDICSVLYSPVLIRGLATVATYHFSVYTEMVYDSDYIAIVLTVIYWRSTNTLLFCNCLL